MNSLKKLIFLPKLSRKQLIGLVSLLMILLSLPLAIFLVQQQQIYRGRAVGPEAFPTNVNLANLHGGGFSVSWTSVHPTTGSFQETTGSVLLGTNQDNLNQEIFDDRGQNTSSTTHHISIFNLNPSTTYFLKIKSGPNNYGKSGANWVKAGAAVQQATPVELALSGNPQPIYGYINNQAGNKITGALIYIYLKKDDSQTKSALMSTITNSGEGWVMDAKNARTENLTSFFSFDSNDQVLIDVQAAQNGIASDNLALSSSSPARDIMTTVPVSTPTPRPTTTPTPTPRPTSTPTPRPTATPTPRPTNTPTPTPAPCSYKVCEGMACVTKEKVSPCPVDSCSTDVNCACTYKACEGTSCVSKTQVPPCPPDGCSDDANCATPSASLNFKIKFQGISSQKPNKVVRAVFSQNNQEKYRLASLGVSSDQTGVYSGTITDIEPGTYDVYLKGWAHLQKKFENVTLNAGENSQDWSAESLRAGDVNNDNYVSGADFGILQSAYFEPGPADLNLDGVVNGADFAIMQPNYFECGDSAPGEQNKCE
jgi:hypothetical protein